MRIVAALIAILLSGLVISHIARTPDKATSNLSSDHVKATERKGGQVKYSRSIFDLSDWFPGIPHYAADPNENTKYPPIVQNGPEENLAIDVKQAEKELSIRLSLSDRDTVSFKAKDGTYYLFNILDSQEGGVDAIIDMSSNRDEKPLVLQDNPDCNDKRFQHIPLKLVSRCYVPYQPDDVDRAPYYGR